MKCSILNPTDIAIMRPFYY